MNFLHEKWNFWKPGFFALLVFYCLFYAPYGVNETDGGFLTGLAWQLKCGKTLYSDVVYVRPPLPVWLRWLEMELIPNAWSILCERWAFYIKVALYSWLGAAVLIRETGPARWMLVAFGFVLSVHCYPAAAWHTVDGILFGVLSIWWWVSFSGKWSAVLSAIFLVGTLLSKQSFYPMLFVWLVLLAFAWKNHLRSRVIFALIAALLVLFAFVAYLHSQDLLGNYWQLTSGAASGNQAIQHGLLDYFRIKPVLVIVSVFTLLPLARTLFKRKKLKSAFWLWGGWLILLAASYLWTIWQRQEFTIPFAQTRLIFWLAVGYGAYNFWKKRWSTERALNFYALLALSWCAAISWGYNLPILFALPWTFAVLDVSNNLFKARDFRLKPDFIPVVVLTGLLLIFYAGYNFIYRNGPRSEMSEHLGAVFPQLSGIYSNPETRNKYQNLKELAMRYGPDFKTLPAFPQANFLCNSPPPLPLDWIVKREMGSGEKQVEEIIQARKHVFFIEKQQLNRIANDPEMEVVRRIVQNGNLIEETPWFKVVEF